MLNLNCTVCGHKISPSSLIERNYNTTPRKHLQNLTHNSGFLKEMFVDFNRCNNYSVFEDFLLFCEPNKDVTTK
jgi:hypothetical protein